MKWPVNIDECRIYMSVEGYGSCFEEPEIFVDGKGRYCFDAIGMLRNKKIGYVSINPYSSHARIECSTTYGQVCSGGAWQYYGKRVSSGTLTIVCSDSYLKLDGKYIYMITNELKYNAFVEKTELKKSITNFINSARNITQEELVDHLKEFPVISMEIQFYDSDTLLVSRNNFLSIAYEKNFSMIMRECELNEMKGLDLTPLVLCNNGKGILLYLNECEG